MKADKTWFAIFGTDGSEFIRATVNSILGVALGVALMIYTVKMVNLFIKRKFIIEQDADRIKWKRDVIKSTVWFLLAGVGTGLMILILNIIPKPATKIDNSSWFDAFGSEKGEVKKIFNWVMAVLIGVSIVIFLAITPWKMIQLISAPDDKKAELESSIRKGIVSIIAIISIELIIMVVANIIKSPVTI